MYGVFWYTHDMSEKNVFQKIIDREIPATIVYEDGNYIAFLDIAPRVFGHTLLIPKQQYAWMQEAPDTVIAEVFVLAKKLMIAMQQGLGCDYVETRVVGNEVLHFHIHLIPRHYGDEKNRERKSYESNEQMQEYAEKIKNAL